MDWVHALRSMSAGLYMQTIDSTTCTRVEYQSQSRGHQRDAFQPVCITRHSSSFMFYNNSEINTDVYNMWNQNGHLPKTHAELAIKLVNKFQGSFSSLHGQ